MCAYFSLKWHKYSFIKGKEGKEEERGEGRREMTRVRSKTKGKMGDEKEQGERRNERVRGGQRQRGDLIQQTSLHYKIHKFPIW